MASKYEIKFDNGERFEFARKDRCERLAESRPNEGYSMWSPSGKLVATVQAKAESNPKSGYPESVYKSAEREFRGSYSIAMVEFAQLLTWGLPEGMGIEIDTFRNSDMLRAVHLTGHKTSVDEFVKVLDSHVKEVMLALVAWQKTTVDERRGMTDMQKYLLHRQFITDYARTVVRLAGEEN